MGEGNRRYRPSFVLEEAHELIFEIREKHIDPKRSSKENSDRIGNLGKFLISMERDPQLEPKVREKAIELREDMEEAIRDVQEKHPRSSLERIYDSVKGIGSRNAGAGIVFTLGLSAPYLIETIYHINTAILYTEVPSAIGGFIVSFLILIGNKKE